MIVPPLRTAALAAVLVCLYGSAEAFDPTTGDFAKDDSTHIRVLSWNLENRFSDSASSTTQDAIGRVLNALQPDIAVFLENDQGDSEATFQSRIEGYTGGTWYVYRGLSDGFDRNVIASRYALSMQIQDTTPDSFVDSGLGNPRGVTAALVDLPDATYGTNDLYFMGLHLKSGGTSSDEERRQIGADAIINWIRDIQTAGGNITLPHSTPIVYAGDMNIDFSDQGDTAPYHPGRTLVTGDIYDESTWGSDRAPDWDGTSNTDAAPYDHNNADSHSQPAVSTGPTSRLDYIYFTDSVMHPANRCIVNTQTMTSGALTASGLQANDTRRVSDGGDGPDHLPLLVDFALGKDLQPEGEIVFNEFSYDDSSTDDRTFIELKNIGGRAVNLEAPVDYAILRANGLPTTSPGSSNLSGTHDLQGVVPPGGVFVLYDNGDQSAGIQATIESALPAVQRQKDSSFILNNNTNTGLALVQREHYDGSSKHTDTLVEALLYNYSGGATQHFLRTDAVTNLTVTLSGNQLGGVLNGADTTISRRVGDRTANDYTDWVIGDTATAGSANSTTSSGPDAAPSAGVAIAAGEVVVNEIDYDDPSTDDESFVEILNKSGRTIDISEVEIVASESGAFKRSYRPGYATLAAGARWVFGTTTDSAGVSGSVNETMSFGGSAIDFLENGSDDGVYLRLIASPSTMIDSVSYAGSAAHLSGSPDSGSAGADSTTITARSLSRNPDGQDSGDNAADFWLAPSTPGATNSLVPVEVDRFRVE